MSRVLLVGKGPPDRGGISAFMQTLLASELATEHQLSLLNLYRDEVLGGGRFTRANLTRTLADAARLWRAARRADVVHINTALVPLPTVLRAGFLALVARIAGARVIVHAHSGRIDLWLRTPLRRLLVRVALAPASRVLTVSETSRKFLARSLGSARVILVDNGVDPAAYTPVAAPEHKLPTILFAGVLSPRKGLIDLIQASTELQRRGVAHQLVVAGGAPEEGPQAEAETREAASHGAPARFIGTQPHEEMARLYRDAVDLEPENTQTWYALGEYYFSYKAWQLAYEALNNAYTYDRFGKAAAPCGLLDQARTKATGYTPPKLNCRGSGRSSSP